MHIYFCSFKPDRGGVSIALCALAGVVFSTAGDEDCRLVGWVGASTTDATPAPALELAEGKAVVLFFPNDRRRSEFPLRLLT